MRKPTTSRLPFYYGWIIVAAGEYAGSENAAEALGFITLIFGLGQISGPVIAGALAGAAIALSALLKAP